MKILVLYRPHSEHGRIIEDFIRDFRQRYDSAKVEALSVDTRDGSATASLYDIMQYPAILVLQTDGYLHKSWEGNTLPLLDEVAAYARV
jgi:hypothetical protein